MNYIYLLIEIILLFFLMIVFFKFGKKEGLFIYIGFISGLLGVVMFKSIDILSFEVNLGVPIVMAIFVCSNIIVQRYGVDEIKKIISTFVISYVVPVIIMSLMTLMGSSDAIYNSNNIDSLFGYNLDSLRIIVSYLLSVGFLLWYNGYMYYSIKKSKNKYFFSSVGSMLIIQFIESIVFVLISYVGLFDINMLFGMIVIRYLFKIVIGIIGLLPTGIILKIKS